MARTRQKTQMEKTVDKTDEKDRKVNTVSLGELSSSSSSLSSAGGDIKAPAAPEREFIYIFPPKGRVCPRCRAADTQAYATKDNIQYRKCNRPICRHRYSVRGTRVKK